MRARRWSAVVATFVCACAPAERVPELDLPPRPTDAPGGYAFVEALRGLDLRAREEKIYAEILGGNVPDGLRRLQRVELTSGTRAVARRVAFWVMPDYLAVGSDEDFVLVPMSPQTAQRIADRIGGSLPTPRMVDAVWRSADVRLAPIRLRPDDEMRTVGYFVRHNDLINGLRVLHDVAPGTFVAGHKKDVVLSTGLDQTPGRVAIYGWHRPEGQPIQALSTALTDDRVDFSHGIRIVHREVEVDGALLDIADVLSDPRLAHLLSNQGTIEDPRYSVVRGDQ